MASRGRSAPSRAVHHAAPKAPVKLAAGTFFQSSRAAPQPVLSGAQIRSAKAAGATTAGEIKKVLSSLPASAVASSAQYAHNPYVGPMPTGVRTGASPSSNSTARALSNAGIGSAGIVSAAAATKSFNIPGAMIGGMAFAGLGGAMAGAGSRAAGGLLKRAVGLLTSKGVFKSVAAALAAGAVVTIGKKIYDAVTRDEIKQKHSKPQLINKKARKVIAKAHRYKKQLRKAASMLGLKLSARGRQRMPMYHESGPGNLNVR